MRLWLSLVLLAGLTGCAASDEPPEEAANPGETAVTEEGSAPIPGAPPELVFTAVDEANRAALRMPLLNEEFEQAIYHLSRLAVDARAVDDRKLETAEVLQGAETALSDMQRICGNLSVAYGNLSRECRRRYLAADSEYGEVINETCRLTMRRQYRQMADVFRAVADLQQAESNMYLSRLHDIRGFRQILQPATRR